MNITFYKYITLNILIWGLKVWCVDDVGITAKEGESLQYTNVNGEPVVNAIGKKKVSVTEISFDSLVEDLVWCGPENHVVLLKTASGRLYRSTNSGKQWSEITNTLSNSSSSTVNTVSNTNNTMNSNSSNSVDKFHVDSMFVCESDKNVVAVLGTGNTHYISSDGALTFKQLGFKGEINMFFFHPTKASWSLLSTWEGDCLSKGTGGDCKHVVYASRDLGSSFRRVAEYVGQFSWGDPTHGSADRIYFSRYDMAFGDQPKQDGWNDAISFRYTDDYGATQHQLLSGGNKFLVSNGYIFVARVADSSRQTVKLCVSTDNGVTFNEARISTELDEKSYTILDTSEGAVIIHVGHHYEGSDVEVGNVYISDASGLNYSLSLPNNVRASSGECEFDKVLSMEGIYLANFRDDSGGYLDPSQQFKTHVNGNVATKSDNMTQIEKKRRNVGHKKIESNVRTVISFNKGAQWNYLTPPKVDSYGQQYQCDPDRCYLHLHGITQFKNFAPFYSVENAVGLILGTGNVGDHLSFDAANVNTFLSRDGGLTWREVHKGAFIYEFGDHGGLLVMAQDQSRTREVVFSWNEGASWFDFSLSKHDLSVNNIVIEPSSSATEFLLYGNRNGVGVVFHLDFATLNQPACRGIWAINSSSSDYETWVPRDMAGNECLLGKKVTYKRRKQASECFNGRDFKRSVDRELCQCTRQDYECEVGFTRSIGSDVCKVEGHFLEREGCTSASYFYTNAYRKVPGDVCVGGWVPDLVAVPCPPHSPLSKESKLLLAFMLVLALFMAAVVYVSNDERFKHLFHNYGFKTFQYVPYSTLSQKKTSLGGRFEPELGFIDAEQEHEEIPTLLSYLHDNDKHQDSKTIELL
ncbi:sortilin-like protein, putative [Theileria annulata]|uniref:Sortilin-like protein, putative n=1 Tax=Theileria annulata TaxID=5874 RepID=Q4UFY4_THEAN|nr:sortilin-like protein, putative [Theileria annulata]CAI74005.1 sortilin-like protein, putative [Theileria annulata]|eukprot:XP_954685.1 sortilin-like protein, putative [Theileria annulata]